MITLTHRSRAAKLLGVPTGIHRPLPRTSYVWIVAGLIALFMVVVAGYAFLYGRASDAAPIFAGGASSNAPPVAYLSSTPSPAPSASASGSPTVTSTPPPSPPAPARKGDFWGSTSGIPAARNVLTVKVLNRTNGSYPDAKVYWSFNGQTHSIAEQPYLDMPANSSGRMYFHLGSPNGKYSDFIEFTVGANVFNGNTTRVDAFVLKIAMRLHAEDGFDTAVGENQRTFAESRPATFARFRAAVPAEFDHLAQGSDRIAAPGGDPAFRPGGLYGAYFKRVSSLAASDIFGCAGPLANNPNDCAALNRHGTTPASWYKASPANYYAKFWHDSSIGHRAYGFPYDDVAAQSTYVSHENPQWLLVAVGF
ncbi:MAG: hypothetical protein QOH97_854 [Actinoplanes sp.]|jgi:hypothetical protein|nr:hypothetical protein [Actinoplanes sp.]